MQPASSQRTRASGIDQVHLEGTPLELAGNPPPAGRRLNRDRGQLSLPRARPLAKPLTRRRETALAQLARIRVEHHCLKNSLVKIGPCIQQSFGPPFVTEDGPRTYRGPEAPSTTSLTAVSAVCVVRTDQ